MPKTGELVLIKIKKIMPHGAYCELTEYGLDAYLPISEIASGWIKNIHEFLKEGQKDVGKVLQVDPQKRTIDISLKKATPREKEAKKSEFGLENRAEHLFDQAITLSKTEAEKEKIKEEVANKFATYSEFLNKVAENHSSIDGIVSNIEFRKSFIDIVEKNIKPKKYEVSYLLEMRLTNPAANVEIIKQALLEIAKQGVKIIYLGAPRYSLLSEDSSYPKAENKIKEANKILNKYAKQIYFNIREDNKAKT